MDVSALCLCASAACLASHLRLVSHRLHAVAFHRLANPSPVVAKHLRSITFSSLLSRSNRMPISSMQSVPMHRIAKLRHGSVPLSDSLPKQSGPVPCQCVAIPCSANALRFRGNSHPCYLCHFFGMLCQRNTLPYWSLPKLSLDARYRSQALHHTVKP